MVEYYVLIKNATIVEGTGKKAYQGNIGIVEDKIKDLGENCKGCKFGETCKGGCTTRSYSLTGKIHNDPLCFYRYEQKIL